MSESKMGQSELIAENEALRQRLRNLEAGLRTPKIDLNAEDSPIKSEIKYQHFYDSAPDMFASIDGANGNVLNCNQAFARNLGYTKNEIIGQQISNFCDSDGKEEREIVFHQFVTTGEVQNAELRLQRKNGTKIDVSLNISCIRDEAGKIVQSVSIWRDITERKRAEEALRQSEEKYRGLVEGSIEGIGVHRDGKILFANDELALIFGYESSESILELDNVLALYPEREHQAHRDRWDARIAGRPISKNIQMQGVKSDGSEVWVECITTVVLWDGGPALQSTYFDITKGKRAEEEIRSSEALLQAVFDALPIWVSVKDKESRYLMVNRQRLHDQNYEANEIIGRRTLDLPGVPLAELEDIIRRDRLVIESGEPLEVREQSITFLGGRKAIFNSHRVPLRDRTGKIVGVVAATWDITERKRAEEELRSSEALLQAVFDALPIWVGVKDKESRYLMANRRWMEDVSGESVDIVGRRTIDLPGFPVAELEQRVREDRQVIESGEPLEIPEYSATLRGGREGIFSSHRVPLRNSTGEIVGLVVASWDITERNQAEEALQRSEKRFRNLIEGSIQGIIVHRNHKALFANNAAAKIFGYDCPDEILQNESTLSLIDSEDRLMTTQRGVARLKGDDVDLRYPFRGVRKDGTGLWVDAVNTVIDWDGSPAILSTQIDYTERKRAEERLAKSEERYRDLVNGSLQGILVHRGHKPLFVNDTFANVYGYDSHTDIMDVPNIVDTLVAPQDRERIKSIAQSRMRGENSPAQYEFQGIKKNGTVFWLDSANTIIQWDNQPAILSTQIDVSQRKNLEDQLRQSQKMEALGTLAGGIAHDFNNVLSPIIGFTDLLLEKAEPGSEEHDFLKTIAESAYRAKDLVSQVLLFSRRGQTAKKVCELRPVAREVTKLMRSTLPRTISVTEDIPDGLAAVLCDSSQFYQVLLNLCVNAGQAMPDTGELNITLENVETEGVECLYGKSLFGRYVRIAVTDTGVGMDDETLSRMFDPFFTTRPVGEGTGLGLSLIFGIVEDHNGGIVVSSKPGRGTSIEIYLPSAEAETEIAVASAAAPPTGSETILFIDDEANIVELGRRILEGAGYDVVGMSDPRMALDRFIEDPERFDLVVTDQSMPMMKGEWLATEMRKLKANLPIILCTGHSVTMNPESSKAIGLNAFLYKPVEACELVATVRRVLDEAMESASTPGHVSN